MVEKVLVSKEFATTLENARKHNSDEEILYALTQSNFSAPITNKNAQSIIQLIRSREGMTLMQMATALTVGYEIELPPEGKVLQSYNEHLNAIKNTTNERDIQYYRGYLRGIEFAAKQFGYDVKEDME